MTIIMGVLGLVVVFGWYVPFLFTGKTYSQVCAEHKTVHTPEQVDAHVRAELYRLGYEYSWNTLMTWDTFRAITGEY